MLITRILFACLPFIGFASCWGELGHRTVAYLAQHHLTPSARDWIHNITNGTDISDESEWADDPTNKDGHGCWHVIDVRDDPCHGNCSVNLSNDCFFWECKDEHGDEYKEKCQKQCIVTILADQVLKVQDKAANEADRRFAIRYVLHLVGDLHQPLHVEGYGGGGHTIKVKFGTQNPTFHQVWDDFILWKMRHVMGAGAVDIKSEAIKWAGELKNTTKLESCPGGVKDPQNVLNCVLNWTKELNKLSCDVVYNQKVCDSKYLKNNDLAGEYFGNVSKTAVEQIQKAAGRLAALINDMHVVVGHSTLMLNTQEL